MNNSQPNYNPNEGQQYNNIPQNGNQTFNQVPNNQNNINVQPETQLNQTSAVTYQNVQTVSNNEQTASVSNNQNITQNNMASVPTVEQSNNNFVQNTQTISSEKKVESKKGINYPLVILLFIIVLVSIFFVFPILKKYI